jgi:hypothetical protein
VLKGDHLFHDDPILLILRKAFNNLHLNRLIAKEIPLNPPLQKGDFTYSLLPGGLYIFPPSWRALYIPPFRKGGSGGILNADPIAGTLYPIVNNIMLRVVIDT